MDNVSNHHNMHLKYLTVLFASYTSIKLGKKRNPTCCFQVGSGGHLLLPGPQCIPRSLPVAHLTPALEAADSGGLASNVGSHVLPTKAIALPCAGPYSQLTKKSLFLLLLHAGIFFPHLGGQAFLLPPLNQLIRVQAQAWTLKSCLSPRNPTEPASHVSRHNQT